MPWQEILGLREKIAQKISRISLNLPLTVCIVRKCKPFADFTSFSPPGITDFFRLPQIGFSDSRKELYILLMFIIYI